MEEAEQTYRAALDEATNHGSRHWAMRIALSLATLCQDQGRHEAVEPLLTPLVTQLSGPRAPMEVRQAREMLDNRAGRMRSS